MYHACFFNFISSRASSLATFVFCVFSTFILVYIHYDFHLMTVNSAGCFAPLCASWLIWFWYQKMYSTDVSMSLTKDLTCANTDPLRHSCSSPLRGLALIDYAYFTLFNWIFFQVFMQLIYRHLFGSTLTNAFLKPKYAISFHYFYRLSEEIYQRRLLQCMTWPTFNKFAFASYFIRHLSPWCSHLDSLIICSAKDLKCMKAI